MVWERMGEESLAQLVEDFKLETDPLKHSNLKIRLIDQKIREIEEAFNFYNDSALRFAIDAALNFISDDSKGIRFNLNIAPKRYKGDWSAD